MPIIAGALIFLLAVVMIAYIPGKLVLRWLKLSVSPLEDATLSMVVGLIVGGCVYWLVAFCGGARFYFLWPLAVSALFLFLGCSPFRWFRRSRPDPGAPTYASSRDFKWQGQHIALAGVVLLGILTMAILPQCYSNVTVDSSGGLTTVNGFPDAAFHIAIANELTHSIPPQCPVFSGRLLNYHYGMDLPVAMFARVTGLTTPDLTLRFVPTLYLVLAMLSLFCFSRAWLGSGAFGALTTFLVFFGEDFSYIPGLILGWTSDWSLAFGIPTTFSLFFTNPMLPGVGLLFAALFSLLSHARNGGRSWLFLAALMLTTLVELKVFLAVHIMASMSIASVLYLLVFRDGRLFRVAALTGLLAFPLLLAALSHNDRGAQIHATFDPWPYVSDAMERLGMAGRFTSVPALICMALPIYLVGCLGLRVIATSRIVKDLVRPTRESGLRFMLAVFVIMGIVLTLTLRIVPKDLEAPYNNSVWLFVQSKHLAWVFAVEVLQGLFCYLAAKGWAPGRAGAAIALATAGLTTPSTVQHVMEQRAADRTVSGREVVATADFIAQHAKPGDVVLASQQLLDPILTLTKCRVPRAYFDTYLASAADIQRRRTALEGFWKAWGRGEVRSNLLQELAVDYVATPESESSFFLTPQRRAANRSAILPPGIALVYDNMGYVVFQVKRNL